MPVEIVSTCSETSGWSPDVLPNKKPSDRHYHQRAFSYS